MATAQLSEAELARIEEERNHLLVSLDDLDAEFGAGDIDDLDYSTLRDDYTARTAQLTRVLDGAAVKRTRRKRTVSQKALWAVGVLALAGLSSWAMIAFSGARGSGETASGQIRQSTVTLLADAAEAFGVGEVDRSIELYDEVLTLQPTNVEAYTYRGWVQYQSGNQDAAVADFDEAVLLDPAYADVRVFRALVALDGEDFETASTELAAFDAADPTAIAQQLVAQRQVRERIGVARMDQLLAEDPGVPDLIAENIGINEAQLAGELFVQLQEPENAVRSFDAVLAADPTNADAMAWHGWTLALLAQSGVEDLFTDAVDWFDRAVEADPTSADARVFRAFVFNRLGQIEDARAELVAFDALSEQPADMVELIEQFGLREALDNAAS